MKRFGAVINYLIDLKYSRNMQKLTSVAVASIALLDLGKASIS